MKQQIFNSLRTVIQLDEDLEKSELDYLVRAENACNIATKDFLRGKIDQETWLDTLEFFGHNIDKYLIDTEDNLKAIGF